jgi:hypothetical protein
VLARYGFATHDIEQYKQFVGDGMDIVDSQGYRQ